VALDPIDLDTSAGRLGGDLHRPRLNELPWEDQVRIKFGDPRTAAVIDFYWREAELLDANLLKQWLGECLHQDLEYTMPVRVGRSRHVALSEGEFVGDMAHFDDDFGSLSGRVDKLATGLAWAEDPPSRTRRHVTNIRAYEAHVSVGASARGDDALMYLARSYLLVLRNRLDRPTFDLISCERVDLLIEDPDGLKVLRREILVDQSCLGTANLAIFL
jgi:3-phenylpropionate/cinnamic acid dioxygenase small subunit